MRTVDGRAREARLCGVQRSQESEQRQGVNAVKDVRVCPRDYKRKEVKSKVALGAGAARGGPGGEGEHCSNERGDSAHTHTRHRTYTRAEERHGEEPHTG